MINDVIFEIKNNKKLYNYLKYHSYWYYVLSFNPSRIKDMIKEMKEELNETVEDKIEDLSKKITFIGNIIDIIK